MDIAILKNDFVPQPLDEKHVDYDEMILRWLRLGMKIDRMTVYRMDEEEKPSYQHDFFVSTGSRCGVNDNLSWFFSYQEVINTLWKKQIPHLGICFGHQMIAKTLGGRVEKSPKGWGLGVHQWKVNEFSNPPSSPFWRDMKKISLCAFHQDQVLGITDEMKVFLQSDFCQYAGLTLGTKIMTVQGHPEFLTEYVRDLLDFRRGRGLYSEEIYLEAKMSLSRSIENVEFVEWVKRFFGF